MINQSEKSIDVSKDGKDHKPGWLNLANLSGILRRNNSHNMPLLQENINTTGEIVFHNDGSVSVVGSRENV